MAETKSGIQDLFSCTQKSHHPVNCHSITGVLYGQIVGRNLSIWRKKNEHTFSISYLTSRESKNLFSLEVQPLTSILSYNILEERDSYTFKAFIHFESRDLLFALNREGNFYSAWRLMKLKVIKIWSLILSWSWLRDLNSCSQSPGLGLPEAHGLHAPARLPAALESAALFRSLASQPSLSSLLLSSCQEFLSSSFFSFLFISFMVCFCFLIQMLSISTKHPFYKLCWHQG